jgi:hypothetical protein
MSPSSTSRISATFFATISRVIPPGSLTAMPSAMVEAAKCGSVPFMAWYIDGKRSTSTPTISIEGFFAFAAMLMPEMSPPPPIATTIVSSPGCCASISSPQVPCPATMSGSSYGCTKVSPRRARSSSANALAPSKFSPSRITSAPWRCVCSTFT